MPLQVIELIEQEKKDLMVLEEQEKHVISNTCR